MEIILRSGKYAGKSIAWVEKHDKNYLNWVKENRPEMLKQPKQTKELPSESSETTSAIRPNTNFCNEGPN